MKKRDPLHHIPRSKWEKSVALKSANVSRTGYFINAQGMKIRWYAWDAKKKKTKTKKNGEDEEDDEIGIVVGAHGSGGARHV